MLNVIISADEALIVRYQKSVETKGESFNCFSITQILIDLFNKSSVLVLNFGNLKN